jgi:hypothetical protein
MGRGPRTQSCHGATLGLIGLRAFGRRNWQECCQSCHSRAGLPARGVDLVDVAVQRRGRGPGHGALRRPQKRLSQPCRCGQRHRVGSVRRATAPAAPHRCWCGCAGGRPTVSTHATNNRFNVGRSAVAAPSVSGVDSSTRSCSRTVRKDCSLLIGHSPTCHPGGPSRDDRLSQGRRPGPRGRGPAHRRRSARTAVAGRQVAWCTVTRRTANATHSRPATHPIAALTRADDPQQVRPYDDLQVTAARASCSTAPGTRVSRSRTLAQNAVIVMCGVWSHRRPSSALRAGWADRRLRLWHAKCTASVVVEDVAQSAREGLGLACVSELAAEDAAVVAREHGRPLPE